jgi:Protein of unknown function (DUF3302)
MTTGFELLCLAILCLGLTMVVYFMVWLHGIPHHIAEANNHPHKRIIHHMCWVSLFTLHAIWPLVYMWSIMPGKNLAVTVNSSPDPALLARVAELERRLENQPTQAVSSVSPKQGA